MDTYRDFETPDEIDTVVVWNNLTVTVQSRRQVFLQKMREKLVGKLPVETIKILNGVSGYAKSGSLIGIMGPSGAGKTTFLAALARRIEVSHGTVEVNGNIIEREIVSKISSFMPQFEALPSSLTAEEYILFACALKVNASARERKLLSEELLISLGLFDSKDTLISDLSGGQKKRLSLAAELITKPKILFLDEPTTGLDTFSAIKVIESLNQVKANNTIVFCTIHQPGMAMYNLFSHIILMVDGRFAYSGDLETARKFFSSQGYVCPENYDESEYYLKLLSPKKSELSWPDSTEDESFPIIEKICKNFSQSSLSGIPEFRITNGIRVQDFQKHSRKSNFFLQFRWLLWRIRLENRRRIFSDWVTWASYFLSTIGVTAFYSGINSATQQGVQNTRGALYMMSSEIVFSIAYSVIYELPSDLLVYIRESSLYAPGPYFLAMFMGQIPKAIIKALLFMAIIYFILYEELKLSDYFFYCLSTGTAAIASVAYGFLFSSWIEDIEITTTIMVPIDMLFLLTAGVFYNLRSLPIYLNFMKYSSIFFYLNEALSITYWSQIKEIECEKNTGLPCLKNGEEVLSEYGHNKWNFWWDLAGLTILTILMGFLGYLGLRRRRTTKSIF